MRKPGRLRSKPNPLPDRGESTMPASRPLTYRMTRRAVVVGLMASTASLALGALASRSARAAPPAQEDVLTPAGRAPGQLSPLITPTAAFYTVTKNAAGDPAIETASWRLVVDGQ